MKRFEMKLLLQLLLLFKHNDLWPSSVSLVMCSWSPHSVGSRAELIGMSEHVRQTLVNPHDHVSDELWKKKQSTPPWTNIHLWVISAAERLTGSGDSGPFILTVCVSWANVTIVSETCSACFTFSAPKTRTDVEKNPDFNFFVFVFVIKIK